MGLSQNYWREDETLARKRLELVIRRRAVRVTVANASDRERAGFGGIFNLQAKSRC